MNEEYYNTKDKIGLDLNTKKKLIKRLIVLSWCFLFCCFIIKLFGYNIFTIICNNERFIKLCNFVDNNLLVRCIIGCCTSFVGCAFFTLSILGKLKFTKKQLIIFTILVIISTIIKFYTNYGSIGDIIELIIIPLLFCGKKYWMYLNILNMNIVNVLFQIISIYIKDIRFKVFDDNTLLSLIFLIDMYIMLLLYYLYSFLLGGKIMGGFFTLFLGNNLDKLNKEKSKREEKLAKLDKIKDKEKIENIKFEINLIDEKIKKLSK